MKKLIVMLFSFGLFATLSFHGHCEPVKIEKVKTEYPVAKFVVETQATPVTTPAFVYLNLVVVDEATSILRSQVVRSGVAKGESTGVNIPFLRKGSDLWRSKKILVFTRERSLRNKAVHFDPYEEEKWQTFLAKVGCHPPVRVNYQI